jgi:hypothetical protein
MFPSYHTFTVAIRKKAPLCGPNNISFGTLAGTAGFQTCCIADFQIGIRTTANGSQVWKPAIQQT